MTDLPPDDNVPRKEPGFVACGAVVLLVLAAFGALAAGIAAMTSSDTGNTITGLLGLVFLAGVVYVGARNPRFVPCMIKGLLAVAVFGIVVFGACVAIVVTSF